MKVVEWVTGAGKPAFTLCRFSRPGRITLLSEAFSYLPANTIKRTPVRIGFL
jgi:hypothetical protein